MRLSAARGLYRLTFHANLGEAPNTVWLERQESGLFARTDEPTDPHARADGNRALVVEWIGRRVEPFGPADLLREVPLKRADGKPVTEDTAAYTVAVIAKDESWLAGVTYHEVMFLSEEIRLKWPPLDPERETKTLERRRRLIRDCRKAISAGRSKHISGPGVSVHIKDSTAHMEMARYLRGRGPEEPEEWIAWFQSELGRLECDWGLVE